MFRILCDPSGNTELCLTEITRSDSPISYKLARFINKKLKNILNLPHIYNVENSQQVSQEVLKLKTTNKIKFITLNIKDLYVNCQYQELCTPPSSG
jgi:hypothetical protein